MAIRLIIVWSQLDRLAGANGKCGATVDPFYLDHLLPDLVRSMKGIENQDVLEELDALYANIEYQVAGQGHRSWQGAAADGQPAARLTRS